MTWIFNSELFNKSSAIDHVNNLSFNRGASTEGELKVLNYIKRELKKEDVEYKIEPFEWTKTLVFFMKLIFSLIIIYVLICDVILFFPDIVWIILPLDILLIITFIMTIKRLMNMERNIYIGKRRESNNIITTVQAKDLYRKRPVIIFSAHHDSKSTRYSVPLIEILYISVLLLLLIYFTLTTILALWSLISIWNFFIINNIFLMIRNIIIMISVPIFILVVIVLLNKNTNESIGSIDNASGVAVLIELAKLIRKNPLERIDVIILWCGAEEWGLWGSKQYCIRHFEELDYDYDLNKSYNINIDMVGSYLGLVNKKGLFKKKELNQNLNPIIYATAKKMNINIKPVMNSFGGGSDYMTFQSFAEKYKKNGFQIGFFNSKEDEIYIHSENDTSERCSAKTLNDCIKLCYDTIRSIDLRVE
ncbi:MAG: M28 family peptidase [Candidatus Lokiarchaeota archaeon]|nr:M28 family peptidase [Candidatus Lokiarchaeota archaeon]